MEFLQPDSEAEPKNQVLFSVPHRCEIDTALMISICTLTCFLENTTNKQKLRGVFIFTYSPGTRTYELESFIKGCFKCLRISFSISLALKTNFSSIITSRVAFAAATHTAFPPKVLICPRTGLLVRQDIN